MLAFASTASAQDLTEVQARSIITPWLSLFNVASRGNVKSTEEQVLTAGLQFLFRISAWRVLGARSPRLKSSPNFANSIPDMKFDIKEVLVAGDRVIVRGEVTGTPAGDLFGVPHSGKSFQNHDN